MWWTSLKRQVGTARRQAVWHAVHWGWREFQNAGMVTAETPAGRAFARFGRGSLMAFPAGSVFGQGSIEIGDDTLIVFSSDNGPVVDDGYQDEAVRKLGGHRPAGGLRGGKYSAFEGGTRVPFLLRWPARVKPGVSAALVCQIDLLASLGALVGGSLVEHGGQNPIEAVRLGSCVLTGPFTHNFRDAYAALFREGGAIEVRSSDDIARQVTLLLQDKLAAKRMQHGADLALQSLGGALAKTLGAIQPLLEKQRA